MVSPDHANRLCQIPAPPITGWNSSETWDSCRLWPRRGPKSKLTPKKLQRWKTHIQPSCQKVSWLQSWKRMLLIEHFIYWVSCPISHSANKHQCYPAPYAPGYLWSRRDDSKTRPPRVCPTVHYWVKAREPQPTVRWRFRTRKRQWRPVWASPRSHSRWVVPRLRLWNWPRNWTRILPIRGSREPSNCPIQPIFPTGKRRDKCRWRFQLWRMVSASAKKKEINPYQKA